MEKEHLEIILENIDKKFDIVIEGYSTLDRKIDNLAKKTDERSASIWSILSFLY